MKKASESLGSGAGSFKRNYDNIGNSWLDGNKFAQIPAKAISDARLKPSDLKVLHTLALYANKSGENCYPKRSTIAKATGLSTSEISRATTRLEKCGWLEKKPASCTTFYKLKQPSAC